MCVLVSSKNVNQHLVSMLLHSLLQKKTNQKINKKIVKAFCPGSVTNPANY